MVQRDKSKKVLDFAINFGPFPFPRLLSNLKERDLINYPSAHVKEDLIYLSRFLKINEKNIIISNGATEIFFLLPTIFNIKSALILAPSFWEYEYTLALHKTHLKFFKLSEKNGFNLKIKELEKAINDTGFIYICNPNNPTSTYINKNDLLYLIKRFKNKTFIVDETYLIFDKNYDKKTLNFNASKLDNLIVICSLSKIFSLGGLRLGFCISSQKNVDIMKKNKNPYSLNIISELLLPHLLKNRRYLLKNRNFIEKEKERVYNKLKEIKYIKPFKPYTNFILVKILNKKISVLKLINFLNKRGIIIREGNIFRGLSDKYFRICIKTKIENDLLIKNLRLFFY